MRLLEEDTLEQDTLEQNPLEQDTLEQQEQQEQKSIQKKQCIIGGSVVILLSSGFILFGVGCSKNTNSPTCISGIIIIFIVIFITCFSGCYLKSI